MQAKTQL